MYTVCIGSDRAVKEPPLRRGYRPVGTCQTLHDSHFWWRRHQTRIRVIFMTLVVVTNVLASASALGIQQRTRLYPRRFGANEAVFHDCLVGINVRLFAHVRLRPNGTRRGVVRLLVTSRTEAASSRRPIAHLDVFQLIENGLCCKWETKNRGKTVAKSSQWK